MLLEPPSPLPEAEPAPDRESEPESDLEPEPEPDRDLDSDREPEPEPGPEPEWVSDCEFRSDREPESRFDSVSEFSLDSLLPFGPGFSPRELLFTASSPGTLAISGGVGIIQLISRCTLELVA